ncbi:MAG: hypothetical protein O2894_08370 [Planctomycetota bacterium]|nr:hypothetical protein [Planctomycetota bacterium]
MIRATLLALLLLPLGALVARAEDAPAAKDAPRPAPVVSAETIEQAIQRGVAHLVATQKANGSWGGPAPNLHVDIYAPTPGSNRAFTVGASGLALSALVEVGGDAPAVQTAIEKGTAYLLANHGVRRQRPDTLYNVWSHMYSLEAFARLLAREKRPEPRKRLLAAAQSCVRWLERMEFVEGGWGYFNFDEQTKDPGPGSTSFTTATGVVALAMAKAQGVEVPDALLAKANKLIRRCEIPGGSFAYSYATRLWVNLGTKGNINRTQGSLARTPVCILAWSMTGYEVDPKRFPQALDELERSGHFLRIARKYPFPHETWFQNSGYFCLYGYYYASQCIALSPESARATYKRQIAGHILGMQEKDGSWWDYQLYETHKPYGTGYALMTLARCRP